MSKERIAGIMMGLSVGVAIGYYLRPQKSGVTAATLAQPEPDSNSRLVTSKPLAKAAGASGGVPVRA